MEELAVMRKPGDNELVVWKKRLECKGENRCSMQLGGIPELHEELCSGETKRNIQY